MVHGFGVLCIFRELWEAEGSILRIRRSHVRVVPGAPAKSRGYGESRNPFFLVFGRLPRLCPAFLSIVHLVTVGAGFRDREFTDRGGAYLDVCRLARKQTHRNLTVFALLGEKAFDPEYLLLETALEEGLVEIREIGPGGSVPELRLVNRAERPLLIVEGEELVACTVTHRQRFLATCARLSGFVWKAILVEATFEDIRAASRVSTSPRTFIQTPFAAPWTPSRPSSAFPSFTHPRCGSFRPSGPPVGFPNISPTGGWKSTGTAGCSSIRMDCDAPCSKGAFWPLDRKGRQGVAI